MKFAYKGRDREGHIVTNTIEAETKKDAFMALQDSGITVFSITEPKGVRLGSITLFNRVRLSEKIMFMKNIAGMLRAGLTLSRALEVISKQLTNQYFRSIVQKLLATIDSGSTFSEGLATFPRVFSPLVSAMVRAGEESGKLPDALSEIAHNLEKSYALNRKIKSALMYPSIIFAAIILIGILMFIYVVPTLTKTFKELNADLPTSTRIVIGISDAVSNHLLLIIGGIVCVVALVIILVRNAHTKRLVDRVVLRIPVLGTLIKEVNTARTTRTLSSLITAGVGISRAISITKEVLQHSQYKQTMGLVEEAVEKGESISSVFIQHSSLYPIMVGEMVQVGEETGKLSDMLKDIATFYEEEVDAKTKDLSTIIEPVLMIVIGGAVGFFAVSMLSPMYSIMDSIK